MATRQEDSLDATLREMGINPDHIVNGTHASRPGEIVLDRRRFGRFDSSYVLWPRITTGIGIAGLITLIAMVVSVYMHQFLLGMCLLFPLAILGIVIGAAGRWASRRVWRAIETQFRHGAIVPGVVTQVNPCTIAYLADLRNHDHADPRSAIQIAATNLTTEFVPDLHIGTRIVGVAVFGGSGSSGYWDKFSALPVVAATADHAAIAHAMSMIAREEWDELKTKLSRLQSLTQPGFYILGQTKDSANSQKTE